MYQICHEWTDQGDPVYRLAYQIVVEKNTVFYQTRKNLKIKIEKKRESEKTHQSFANNNNSLDLGIGWVGGGYIIKDYTTMNMDPFSLAASMNK